jgi:hypothetical protein
MVADLFHSAAHHEHGKECAPASLHRLTPSPPPTPPGGICFELYPLNFADQSASEPLDKFHGDTRCVRARIQSEGNFASSSLVQRFTRTTVVPVGNCPVPGLNALIIQPLFRALKRPAPLKDSRTDFHAWGRPAEPLILPPARQFTTVVLGRQGWLGFVVSHPGRKEQRRAEGGAPSIIV